MEVEESLEQVSEERDWQAIKLLGGRHNIISSFSAHGMAMMNYVRCDFLHVYVAPCE